MLEILAQYDNGGYQVQLTADGTKTRTQTAPGATPIYPESIDVKITDYCNMGCAYCHESSTTAGTHGDLTALLDVLSVLPRGIELAIGGGNPLAHPDLVMFLHAAKSAGFICNITVNQGHVLGRHPHTIAHLVSEGLVYGVGVSLTDVAQLDRIQPLLALTPNVVFHVIAGVHSHDIITEIAAVSPESAILILGYKQFGFGAAHFSADIAACINDWRRALPQYLGTHHLSFDNLALEQLQAERLLTRDAWSRLYMGDDFQFTMYVDAVRQQYAPTSRSNERAPFSAVALLDYFQRNKISDSDSV